MRDGRVEQLGAPGELYDRPRTAFVAGFIGQQNFLAGRVEADGQLRADSGMAVEAAQQAPGLAPGARGLAAIRPEYVTLSAREPANGANKLQVQVIAVVMLGDTLEYVLRMADGEELFARLPRNAAERPEQGAAVWAHWDRAQAAIFPYEEMATRVRAIRRRPGGEGA
jgi:spermidine/putrescine transport system ATP-binding protein